MTLLRTTASFLLLLTGAGAGGAAGAVPSGGHLTVSNGMLSAVVDGRTGIVAEVLPRIYRIDDSGRRVEPFLKDFRFAGAGVPEEVEYHRNTHVVRVKYPSLSLYYFAPMTSGERVFYVAVEGEEDAVERAAFLWEAMGEGVRTLELTYGRKGGGVRRYLLFSPRDSARGEDGDLRPSRARLQTYQGSLLDNEIQYMRMVIDGARLPTRLTAGERRVAEQSISALKMAQVSPFDPEVGSRGMIVASLPPGERNVGSVGDGCLAIMALSRVGLKEEARDALRYFLGKGRAGAAVSDLGLLLVAYADFGLRCRDTLFLRETYLKVMEGLADTLAGMVQGNGLMPREGGSGGGDVPARQYTSTSAVCAAGLREFARLGRDFGGSEWRTHALAAEQLRQGIGKHLVVGGRYVRRYAGPRMASRAIELASLEIFALRVLPDSSLFRSHLRMFRRSGSKQDGGSPSDLRAVSALAAFGERTRARQILQLVTDRALASHALILGDSTGTGCPVSAKAPTIGMGAGAYLLALSDLAD